MANQVIWASYPTAAVVVVLFGVFAGLYTHYRHKRTGQDTTEFFLTARRSVGWWRIGWSFYAAAMGSWALFSPGSYAYYAGILGLAMYAFASGLPILIIAFLGSRIHQLVPNICSFTDFTNRRFGMVVQVYVSMLMLFNMGVAMTAEFTAVGDMFAIVIGSIRWPMVVIIGLVSAGYTAYGGLYVSIVTDQVQAFASLAMVLVLFIFVAATFRAPLPRPLPSNLAVNFYGLSSIADMPISLFTSTVFSEAMWQRCWATVDKKQLRLGATIGSIAVMCVVFLFGFGGVLADWSGLFVPAGPDDEGNTILFSLLDNVDGHRHTIIVVVVAVLSVTMSTSAIDSLQNALVDTISGVYLKRVRLIWVRLLVLALTVPCMIVSLKSYNIIQLFLTANLLTSTSTIPVLMGLWHTPLGLKVVTPFSMLFGCAQGIASIFWWAKLDQSVSLGETYSQALHRIWTVDYQWQDFIIAPAMSFGGLLAGAVLEYAFRRLTGRPYDLSNPFKQDDIMPVDAVPPPGKDSLDETDSSESDAYEKPEKA